MKQSNLRQPATQSNKQPWLAVNLSAFFPGIGQIYAGKFVKGIVLTFSEIISIAIAVWLIFSPAGNTLAGFKFLVVVVGIYIFNLFDAYQSLIDPTRQTPKKPSPKPIPNYSSFTFHPSSAPKDAWLAVFFSQILPGIGHLYLEKFLAGGLFIVGTIILANLANLFTPLLIVPPVLYAIASYDAYQAAPKKPRHSQQTLAAICGIIFTLKLAITYLPIGLEQRVERFIIPSGSMLPTLQEGDGIFVNKDSHYLPNTGDIIVFQAPPTSRSANVTADTFFVKRVIGEPGQVVKVTNGIVYVNNQPLQEEYLAGNPDYEWGPEKVPYKAYWVLGDNRNDSFDSHVWGFLPASNIIGKAYKIYWPPARIKPLR